MTKTYENDILIAEFMQNDTIENVHNYIKQEKKVFTKLFYSGVDYSSMTVTESKQLTLDYQRDWAKLEDFLYDNITLK